MCLRPVILKNAILRFRLRAISPLVRREKGVLSDLRPLLAVSGPSVSTFAKQFQPPLNLKPEGYHRFRWLRNEGMKLSTACGGGNLCPGH